MDKNKSDAYKNLVAQMQNKYPNFDKNSDEKLFSPFIDGKNICREINLYTYWQGLGYAEKTPKIKYLFVLQDFGCIFSDDEGIENFVERIKKINAGENISYFSKKINNSSTDKNLIKLFEVLGYDLNKRYDELFFTNFCLGYRKNPDVKITRKLMMQDAEMFKKLCETLEPEKIIAMGRKTFECVYKSLTGEDNAELLHFKFWNDFLENHSPINVRIKGNSVKIIPVAHCGDHGIENRNWNKDELANQFRDWREFKKSEKNYTYQTVDDAIENREETFAEFLFKLIAEKGLKNSQIYNKNNKEYIQRKTFSDIKNRKDYNPSKETIIKIVFLMELSVEDAQKVLQKAGYFLSASNDLDLVVTHFIATKNFNPEELDEELYKRNLPCIFSTK